MSKPLTTDQVIERLSKKYAQPEYGFLTQVRNGAGFSATRTMDAMAMSLWPSRGLHITGFEVKVSRGDFMREIKNPSKADELACFCDYWYVVVGDKEIVKPGDLPPTWGLIVPSGTGLKVAKEATKLKPQQIDNSFFAAIMRNMTKGMIPAESIKARVEAARVAGKESSKYAIERAEQELKNYRSQVEEFERASGVQVLGGWKDQKDIGEAVAAVLSGRDKRAKKRLEDLRGSAERIVQFIKGEEETW